MDINQTLASLKDEMIGRIANLLARPILTYLNESTDRAITPARLLFEESRKESMQFFKDRMEKALLFETVADTWQTVMRLVLQEPAFQEKPGLFLEFGVHEGVSTNFFAQLLAPRGIRLTGFDAFKGLEEEWTGSRFSPGDFDRNGQPPPVNPNVDLQIGWVQDTLPGFLAANMGLPCYFAHLDFDTYTPTAFALKQIKPRLVKGSILLFDELYGYPGWRDHEYKALMEVLDESSYEYIVFGPQQVAIRIV